MGKAVYRFVLVSFLTVITLALMGQMSYADNMSMLRVGHVGHDHQIALYVAAEAGKDLEKDYGVYLKELKPLEVYDLYDKGRFVARIHMIRVGGGSKMPAALEQGHIEVGLGGLGPVAKFVDKGSELKVLAPLNNDGDALIMRKDFPAKNWKEFIDEVKRSERPIKIGYKAPMAVAYMILTRALAEEDLSYGPEAVGSDGKPVEVLTVNIHGLKNALPSLESGIVDGVVVNEPMAATLVHKGVGRRVEDLSQLPPEGKWKGHPCCIVAASGDSLREKRDIIISFLKVIAAGGDLMSRDAEKAYEAEALWTRTDPEVGRMSIANVSYVIRPDTDWLNGVDTWIELMTTSGHFNKLLKGKSATVIKDKVLDLSLMKEALSEMKLHSEQK